MHMLSSNTEYLTDVRIEEEANALLDQARARGLQTEPPIPVEDILERVLGLFLRFDNLGADELGRLEIPLRLVTINEFLLPEVTPGLEGRYRFTVAHEIGHWCLHRSLAHPLPCRTCSTPRKPRMEIQADRFATCLLMPRWDVLEAWRDDQWLSPQWDRLMPVSDIMSRAQGRGERETEDDSATAAVRRLADMFGVSLQAMTIRLEQLHLRARRGQPGLARVRF